MYFQIKKGKIESKSDELNEIKHTLQFIDISSKIFYDDIKAQDEFSSLINSTISHEMRNPLNSIINQCAV
jgi:signal transduction histidine kinase